MLELVKKENNNNWTSKKELMNNLQISSDTIEQIISDLSCRRPAYTQIHIKKGGYHNSEVIYDDYLVNMITAELSKHNTNQNTGVIQKQMNTEAKEQGILLNAVANSGDLKAAQALCDLIMENTSRKQKTIRTNQTNGARFKLYCRNRLEKMERSKKRIGTEF